MFSVIGKGFFTYKMSHLVLFSKMRNDNVWIVELCIILSLF